MEIIVPAAGLSSRFPNMKPKYLLYDYKHDMMLKNSIRQFIRQYNVTIGILKEHDDKFHAKEFIDYNFGDNVKVVILNEPTKGPAATVAQIIQQANIKGEILIKDCDSFFDHEVRDGNYICVSKISEHEVLKKLSSKSFVVSNEQNIITNIIEKQVVSDTFCVGAYKFDSAEEFTKAYNDISIYEGEIYVSDVIGRMIDLGHIFTEQKVSNYVDVGTSSDWFEYNNKPVIFCDIDGTIIKAQSRVGANNFDDDPIPLTKNISRLLEMQKNGAQFIFTTARNKSLENRTRKVLNDLGFVNYELIMSLLNSKRILINDYNDANPYPRAEAINIRRDSDNLGDFI